MDYIFNESQIRKIIQEEFVEKPFVNLFQKTFNSFMRQTFDWFIGSNVNSIHIKSQISFEKVIPYIDIFVDKQKLEESAKNNSELYSDLKIDYEGGPITRDSEKYDEIKVLIISLLRNLSIIDESKLTYLDTYHISVFFA